MIVGVGTDLVSVERLSAALARTPGLLTRVFVPAEADVPLPSLAARFAAKEAVAKALGRPRNMNWRHAWVERASGGRPVLHVEGYEHLIWHVSLTHDAGFASALVIAQERPE